MAGKILALTILMLLLGGCAVLNYPGYSFAQDRIRCWTQAVRTPCHAEARPTGSHL